MSENQQRKDPLANGEAVIIKIECHIPESGGFEAAGKEIRHALEALGPVLSMAGCRTQYSEITFSPCPEEANETTILICGEPLTGADGSPVKDRLVRRLLQIVFDPPAAEE